MTLLLLVLQVTLYDVFSYAAQEESRAVPESVETVTIANLSDYGLLQLTDVVVCGNETFLFYDAARKALFRLDSVGINEITSGTGGGPLDLNIGRGFSCYDSHIAYYDTQLKRISVYDIAEQEILYQKVVEGNVDQLFLYENTLYYFNTESFFDQPLEWLHRVDLGTRDEEVVFRVDSSEIGKGIVLGGKTAGYEDTFCHVTVFSGLLACFSANSSSLLYGRPPVHKQGFIEVTDRSHLVGAKPGAIIGKSPDDKVVSRGIAVSENHAFVYPVQNEIRGTVIDIYDLSTGDYLRSMSFDGRRFVALSAFANQLFAIEYKREENSLHLLEVIF
jgi:hypothetical protein